MGGGLIFKGDLIVSRIRGQFRSFVAFEKKALTVYM